MKLIAGDYAVLYLQSMSTLHIEWLGIAVSNNSCGIKDTQYGVSR